MSKGRNWVKFDCSRKDAVNNTGDPWKHMKNRIYLKKYMLCWKFWSLIFVQYKITLVVPQPRAKFFNKAYVPFIFIWQKRIQIYNETAYLISYSWSYGSNPKTPSLPIFVVYFTKSTKYSIIQLISPSTFSVFILP